MIEAAQLQCEKSRVARGALRKPTASTSALRDSVLARLGPVTGSMYDPEAMALLDQFEAALRADWEKIGRISVRDQAHSAIAAALGVPTQWRLV